VSTADDDEKPGKFGFGRGIAVGLRPNVGTDATWPLAVGVPSIGLENRDRFQVLGIRVSTEHFTEDMDMPLITVSPRWDHQFFDVHFLDAQTGKCNAVAPTRFVCRALPPAVESAQDAPRHARIVALCVACVIGKNSSAALKVEELGSSAASKEISVSGPSSPWVSWTVDLQGDASRVHQWVVKANGQKK
jgi:hypothetical protein